MNDPVTLAETISALPADEPESIASEGLLMLASDRKNETVNETISTDELSKHIIEVKKSRRNYSEGRSSTLRKVMRFASRTTDSIKRPTKTVNGKTFELHPTKGWRVA